MKTKAFINKLTSSKHVRHRVILAVLFVELFSLIFWGTLTYQSSREELSNSISRQLSEAAYRTKIEIGNFLLPINIQTKMLAEEITYSSEHKTTGIKTLLHRFMRTRAEIEEISLTDQNAKEKVRISRINNYGINDNRDFSLDKQIIHAVSKKQQLSTLFFSQYLEPQLQIVTPIKSNNSTYHSIMTLINLNGLWDILQTQQIGQSGYVYVVDQHYKLIAHRNQSLVLRQTLMTETSIHKEILSKNSDKQYKVYKSIEGNLVAGVSHYDEVNRWWVIVEQPVEEGLAPLRRIIDRFILVFIIAVTVTVLAVLIFNQMADTLDLQIEKLTKSENTLRLSEEKYHQLSDTLKLRVNEATIELTESNKNLENTLEIAEKANSAKSLFLANMSHELRTPLNAVIGYSELIIEDSKEDQTLRDAQKIAASGKHLLLLINNLLDLSKIEAGKMEVLIEDIDIKVLIRDVLETVMPMITENNNSIEVNYLNIENYIASDILKLKQIMVNLLDNASKFTVNGSITLTISDNGLNNVSFIVEDSGIGINEYQLLNLFKIYSRSDQAIQHRINGSGLGLVISRHYCNLLGGDILVKSVEGQGSTFTMVLPKYFDQIETSEYDIKYINSVNSHNAA